QALGPCSVAGLWPAFSSLVLPWWRPAVSICSSRGGLYSGSARWVLVIATVAVGILRWDSAPLFHNKTNDHQDQRRDHLNRGFGHDVGAKAGLWNPMY